MWLASFNQQVVKVIYVSFDKSFYSWFLWKKRYPGQGNIGKICKISSEKLFFPPQILDIILRWNAVNAGKLCKFTARLSGEITHLSGELWWIFVRSPLTLAVNLHNFTAFTHFTEKLSTKFTVKKKQLFIAYITYFSEFLLSDVCSSKLVLAFALAFLASLKIRGSALLSSIRSAPDLAAKEKKTLNS